MHIGKYITNPGVIAAAAGALGTARQSRNMRRDWRRYVVWGVWIASLSLAIAEVAMQEPDRAE